MSLPAAFYEPSGVAAYHPTRATMSPWDERMQHGGPPSALAVHALERAFPRPELRIARVTVEFLGPIPREEMHAAVAVVRPGKRVELARTTLSVHGRAVVEASIWRIAARADIPVPGLVAAREREHAAAPVPNEQVQEGFEGLSGWGYGEAIEWRFTGGGFRVPGPAKVWTRLRVPLIAGEAPNGIERIATVADSANGISAEFALHAYVFVPTSITLTLDRAPRGVWMHLDATTHVGDEGLGFSACSLGDEHGIFGIATQPLLFAPREPTAAPGGVAPAG